MHPERPDIAAPPFPARLAWVGEEPRRMERLTAAGPVLVHFLDFAQLNSVRSLPYPVAWAARYRRAGLSVIGVHSPRFAFTSDLETLAAGLRRLGVSHPVAADVDYGLWRAYGCEGWPSLFLWGRGGALRWFHFGEGEYEATERVIQAELQATNGARSLPRPLAPLRPSDAAGAVVIAPTDEVLPGGSIRRPWSPTEGLPAIELGYAAGGAHATVDGSGQLLLCLDDEDPRPIAVGLPGLYELATHPAHEEHRLRIEPAPGIRVWSVSFSPGLPSGS